MNTTGHHEVGGSGSSELSIGGRASSKSGPKKWNKQRPDPSALGAVGSDQNGISRFEAIARKEAMQFERDHVLPKESCTSLEAPLDSKFVGQFHLRNVSPLQHRLSWPLLQAVEMEKYVPQKFHLMTKESYKCPNASCGKYVCKPTLRGRQANYDKRYHSLFLSSYLFSQCSENIFNF